MLTDVDVVFFDIGDTLVTNAQWVSGAKQLVSDLAQSPLRLGLISNTGDLTRAQLEDLLPADFDFSLYEDELVVLSSEAGLEKPDVRIFDYAIGKAMVPPWRTVFVGENPAETSAAQGAGMRAARVLRAPEDFDALRELLLPAH